MSDFFGTPFGMEPMDGESTSWESPAYGVDDLERDGLPKNDFIDVVRPSRIIGEPWWNNYDFSATPGLATLTGSFTNPISLVIEGTFPAWTADVVIEDTSCYIAGEFPVWTSDVHILTGEIVTIEGEFPKWTGLISIPGGHANISGKFPRWSSDVRIVSGEILSIAGEFPRWTGSLIVKPNVGAFVLTGTFPSWSGIVSIREAVSLYAAIIMNTSNHAVTEYAQFPISSLGYMNGHYFGTSSDGIYLLEGEKDAGTNIVAEIETGPLDLGMGFLKRPREAWFVFRSDGTVILRIRVDEQQPYEAELAYLHEQIREGRVKFAKGLKKRFAAFGMKNKDGSSFDLDSIRIMVDPIRGKQR